MESTLPNLASTRVVLVGRTGLDAALRLDPRLELARVRSLLDAIAEVAAYNLEAGQEACVVVAEDIAGDALGTGRWERFLAQLRAQSPSARVLVCTGSHARWPGASGVLNPAMSAESLRESVAKQSGDTAAPAVALGTPLDVAATLPSSPVQGVPASIAAAMLGPSSADGSLVVLLMRGLDIGPAAVALIRDRLRDGTVEFFAPGQDIPPSHGAVACEVAYEGQRLGTLRATSSSVETLLPHARWLGLWLRLRDQQAQLREAAFTDPLTGAWNRRYFDRYLSGALHEAQLQRQFVTILLFDIDNFKQYNDLYGHDAGDDVLVETVRMLRSVIRPSDRVCRLGGDEFVVIFHDPSGPRSEGSKHPLTVQQIAERFQQQVRNHKFPKLAASAPGPLGISGGLATFPWDGRSPQELLARADELLLVSKKQGKNAIVFGPAPGASSAAPSR